MLTLVMLVVPFCVETFLVRGQRWNSSYHLQELVDYITISITLLVVAVPEGLPLAVVLALAVSIKVGDRSVLFARLYISCRGCGRLV